jgi:ferredoxin-type protein NapH
MDKYNTRATIEDTGFFDTFITTNKDGKKKLGIRFYRWFVVIFVHLLFILSYYIDLQMLEGDLSGSRFLGFHLTDPFMTLQVFASTHHIPINLTIGTLTIVVIYLIMGGRAYCSWVCPYTILGEISEKLHRYLKNRNIAQNIYFILWLNLYDFISFLFFKYLCNFSDISPKIVYGQTHEQYALPPIIK